MADRRRTATGSDQPSAEREAVFAALAEERRRYVLHCLQTEESSMPLRDLADEVAAWQNDEQVADFPDDEVKRVYLSLYHKHVPKLVDAGLVRHDTEQDTVVLLERGERVEDEFDVSATE